MAAMPTIPPVPFWFKTSTGVMYRALDRTGDISYNSAASRLYGSYKSYPIHLFPFEGGMYDVMPINDHIKVIPFTSILSLTPEEEREMVQSRAIDTKIHNECIGFFDGECYWFYPIERILSDGFQDEISQLREKVFSPPSQEDLIMEALTNENTRRKEEGLPFLTSEEADEIIARINQSPTQPRRSERLMNKSTGKKGGRRKSRKIRKNKKYNK
jgi:hypothetical protein